MTPQPNRDGESDLVARLTNLYAQLATGSKNYDAEAVADAIARLRTLEARLDDSDANVEKLRRVVSHNYGFYVPTRAMRAILAAIKGAPDEQ